MIVIGSIHVDNCPREPKIPIYLIVAGAVHVVAFSLMPLKKVAEKAAYFIEGLLGLFSFCWFIAGSVWVFSIYPENPRACNDMVYKFAFGILIFEYVFIALVIAIVCLCTCCLGCIVALLGGQSDDSECTHQSPEDGETLK
ncbi:transmembrane protein 272-like [Rhinophrynus dorsalis]